MKTIFLAALCLLGPDAFAHEIRGECALHAMFEGVPGNYDAGLQIGNKLFHDQLRITGMTHHPGMLGFREFLTGEYSVPGIFTVPIEDGVVESTDGRDGMRISFRISAREKGETYPVFYEVNADINKVCLMHGTAYLDEKHQQKLGDLTLRRHVKDCSCDLR